MHVSVRIVVGKDSNADYPTTCLTSPRKRSPVSSKKKVFPAFLTSLLAELKEELQEKGVDVKGLKLKKDYVEKLQAVLDLESNAEEPQTSEEP